MIILNDQQQMIFSSLQSSAANNVQHGINVRANVMPFEMKITRLMTNDHMTRMCPGLDHYILVVRYHVVMCVCI